MKKGSMLSTAILIATNAHSGQFDKGGMPYILHPLKVMHYTKSQDEVVQVVAVLHDVIEDTNVTYKDLLNQGICQEAIDAIKCLTKQPGQTYDEYKELVKSNKTAIKVKMADLRHNSDIRRLKGVTEKDIARVSKYHQFYLELQQIAE